MKLHILGCGDAFGSGGCHQSGYLVETADRMFLLDCGPTTLLAMKRAGLDPRRLNAIILSHLHGDHFGGIPFFFLEYLYQEAKQSQPLIIAGPPGTETKVRQLFQVMYGSGANEKALPPTNFQILYPGKPAQVDGIEVFPFRVPHQVDEISLGLKVSCDGKQLLFSGDSAWTDMFIDQARGVDLFLCECSFYRAEAGMHVHYEALRGHLARLECKQLILTHLGEEMLSQREALALEGITLATDGMVVEF